ncbi:MAG: hypothetical protein AB8B74_00325 [Crocinitomicaceae bacterium]
MDKHIHIVAFDVPFPPNYGGVIDLYFQLKALHQIGVKITYHCFYYDGNNPPSNQLDQFADTVIYYHRKKNIGKLLLSKLPFIVATRSDKNLLENLLKDDSPIIFSGLQTCFYLNHSSLKKRTKIVRTHNIEHNYYRGLANVESNKLKKQYFLWEAKKLEKYEQELRHAQAILSIAKMDILHFEKYAPTFHSPPFFRFKERSLGFEMKSTYGLFQGNLSVGENIETVKFIAKYIVPNTKHKIVIAGKDPSEKIVNIVSQFDNLELISNPEQEDMNVLIEKAQVNLLFTNQQTGIKLKLLHALAIGKHIIINSKMDDDGMFKNLCTIEDDPKIILDIFESKMSSMFSEKMFWDRKEKFLKTFNNELNAIETARIIASIE